ncbi:unnamed protein product [Closterium sp. Naga37s-1]|nr:unnamed protein product [Closterium sp. Naga37s-1]
MGVAKGAVATVSANECDFILAAVRDELRVDGRKPFDYRSWDSSTCDGTFSSTKPASCLLLAPPPRIPPRAPASSSPVPYTPFPNPSMLNLFPQALFPQTLFPQTHFPRTFFPQNLFPKPSSPKPSSPKPPSPKPSSPKPSSPKPSSPKPSSPKPSSPKPSSPKPSSPKPSIPKPSIQFSDAGRIRVDGTAEVRVDTTCILARTTAQQRNSWAVHASSPPCQSATFTLPFPSSLYPAPLIIPHAPFTRDDGTAEVQLGSTRVLASVSAALTLPFPDRPNEGSLAVFTELAPMADPRFVPGRPGEDAIELGRIIDRGLRESHAVDTESLCVVAGRAAWALRLDIRVMDNDGNLVDACCLAAVAALLAFRRPEVTVGGDDGMQVVVHSVEERDPIPLTVHNLPLAVTFAYFNDGNDVVMDPSYKEEAAQAGRCTVLVNAVGGVCNAHSGRGVATQPLCLQPPTSNSHHPMPGHGPELQSGRCIVLVNAVGDVCSMQIYKEEAAQAGRCTVLVNVVGDVCSVQKGGGVGVSLPQLMRCCRVAASVAQHMIKTLTDKVAALAAERQRRKVKRHASPAAGAAAPVGLDTVAGGAEGAGGLKGGVIGAAEIAAVQRKGGGVRAGQAGGDGDGGRVKEEHMEDDEGEEGEEGEEESSDGEDGEDEEEEGEGDGGRGGAAGGGVDALFEGGVSSWLQEERDDKKSNKGATAARLGSELDAIADLLPSTAAPPAPASKASAARAVPAAGKGEGDLPAAAAAGGAGSRVKEESLTLADAVKKPKKKKKSKAEH